MWRTSKLSSVVVGAVEKVAYQSNEDIVGMKRR